MADAAEIEAKKEAKRARREARRMARRARRKAERALFEAWYGELDPESKGVIEVALAVKLLKKYGYKDDEIKVLLEEAEKSGVMTVEEFVKWMQNTKADHESARMRQAAGATEGGTGDGFVTLLELEKMRKEQVPELTDAEMATLLERVTKETDGRIKLEAFITVFKAAEEEYLAAEAAVAAAAAPKKK